MKRRLAHRAATEIAASEVVSSASAAVVGRSSAHHRTKTDKNHRRY